MKLERLTADETHARAAELIEIYGLAFNEPPWNEDGPGIAAFARRLTTDLRRPGFVAVLASSNGIPAGFGTAWPTPRPFPTGRAYDRVRAALGDQVETRLAGTLEVDELAVAPHARRQGLAGRILQLLCADADDSWLLTSPKALDAIRLYEAHGWQRLTGPADVVVFARPPRARDLGTTVTYLEMNDPDDLRPGRAVPALSLHRVDGTLPLLHAALARIGGAYGWGSATRSAQGWRELTLAHPLRQFWLISLGSTTAGVAVMEPQPDGDVEIVTFGLLPEYIGRGLGGPALTLTVRQAWASEAVEADAVHRVWLHTRSRDHPNALRNYRRRGLRVYRTEVQL
ncbi:MULTISPECIES: GNAT family N-acetyltransferase [unclassified Kitasatospora]|uniref:GNAT family N-acetyltransferase n=1 Tax=unclassified Kitasatospora TaxID=2633591 RepID=UPI0009EAC012|nr:MULTISPECIES: GNAT family N-acetyltransferase [unclassified Kitasatospora]